MIRMASVDDAGDIAGIYNPYIAHTVITFEEREVTSSQMADRISEVLSSSLPWLAADRSGQVAAYAYAHPWKTRSAYRFSVETAVYVHRDHVGCGLGSELYEALFAALRDRGVHVAVAGIALPNERSIALHEKFGLRRVAHFEEVGFKFGRWIDVGYWQKVL
ncbi:MAG: N-acetyltransferase family protein [Deltaproteobacteria bacterium]|nr:N-acetyltransferase family protein [Deltaproteobacteria bacterium]